MLDVAYFVILMCLIVAAAAGPAEPRHEVEVNGHDEPDDIGEDERTP